MKRILYFLLTPAIAISLVLVKEYEADIKQWNEYAPLGLIIFLIGATFYNAYISTISPYKVLENIKQKRWDSLNEEVDKIIDKYAKDHHSVLLGFNIMVPERRLFSYIERNESNKGKKISLFPIVLKVIWKRGNHIHSKLKFTTKQGGCGQAFSNERTLGWNFEAMKTAGINTSQVFNLSSAQKDLIKDLSLLVSSPIIHEKNRADSQNSKIIGVLNVESDTPKSGALLNHPKNCDELIYLIQDISTFYIKMTYF